jgi:hypothetical protein
LKGVFTQCPFIGGDVAEYGDLDGYSISKDFSSGLYKLYTPDGVDETKQHLAFPARVTVEQLKGFVPTVVHVNELDPLIYEGAFSRMNRNISAYYLYFYLDIHFFRFQYMQD